VARVESGTPTLHCEGAASRSVVVGAGILAFELRAGSVDIPATGGATLMFGSCGRTGQNVPGTPPSVAYEGSRVIAAESTGVGTGVNPREVQAMARVQVRPTREKLGENASAPAALSATAITAMALARRSISCPSIRIRILSASPAPIARQKTAACPARSRGSNLCDCGPRERLIFFPVEEAASFEIDVDYFGRDTWTRAA